MISDSWPAILASLPPIQAFVEQGLDGTGLSPKRITQLTIAVEELVVNALTHGHADTGGGELEITIEALPESVRLKVCDDSEPFDPSDAAAPDLQAPPTERPAGGLGIFMVKKFVDTFEYKRQAGRNIVTLTLSTREKA